MAEVEEYQKLLNDRNAQAGEWAAQRTSLVLMAERHLAEVKEDGDAKGGQDAALKAQLAAEKAEAQREFQEMATQLEDDVDTEIENIRDR
jgi:dsDNA-specific endonuclease/ATPase MutS2